MPNIEEGSGNLGEWITDEFGLPAYKYTCNQLEDPNAKTPTTYGYSTDHFHQIGNERITATAHNGGYVQVLDGTRGFQWLTYRNKKKNKLGGGICFFKINNETKFYSDLYCKETLERISGFERIFGIGYFLKKLNLNNIKLEHYIIAPFSDDPVFISQIIIENRTDKQIKIELIELWDIYLYYLTKSLIVTSNNRKLFGKTRLLNLTGKLIKSLQKIVKMDTDGSREKFAKKFKFNAEINENLKTIIVKPTYKGKISVKRDEPVKYNYYPKSIFLSVLEGNIKNYHWDKDLVFENNNIDLNRNENIKNPCVAISSKLILQENQSKKLVFLFGYSDLKNIEKLIEKYKHIISEQDILKWNAEKWKDSLIELNISGYDTKWLPRESKWHSYYVRSAGFYDEYYNAHKFPQGSIYLFGHGFDGAIRDFMLYLPSIIFINPGLAKEYLMATLKLMRPDGKLPYGLYGFGKAIAASVHSKPSDLYLFLIWGIIEYIYLTRDFDFLNQKIEFYPKALNKSSTVLERLIISLNYLFSEKVGFGEHGLIKCNDGDWSDGISFMVKNRRKFIKKGESAFNSAFALYLIPKLIPLLQIYNPDLADKCNEIFENLKNAIFKATNGKWFYRGYDGIGNPIGNDNMFLEHHTWLLISKILKNEHAAKLIKQIYENLDKHSPIGQYISYPAQKTKFNLLPEGWDVNGGIWHAMNSLLTWGYSIYDSEKAINSLIKNSMTRRAEVYPDLWYGIWSGPDAYIADYAENAGQAFYHLPTPMCDFPLMNLNLHACYLLSLIKFIGIEADYNSIIINPSISYLNFQFYSPLISISADNKNLIIEIKGINIYNLILKIKKPDFIAKDFTAYINENKVIGKFGEYNLDNNMIMIKINKSYKKVRILITNKNTNSG
ncbi:MAG: GH36-type glycosyl hydrolase domain-containing protein [Promethearchaeota archaeon]